MRWHVHFNEQGLGFREAGKPAAGSGRALALLTTSNAEPCGRGRNERFFVFGTGRIHTRCGTAREEDEELWIIIMCVFSTLFLTTSFQPLVLRYKQILEFKLIEQRFQYFDRLDYVSVIFNEHSLVWDLKVITTQFMCVYFLIAIVLECSLVFYDYFV